MEPVASSGRALLKQAVVCIVSALLLFAVAHAMWGASARAEGVSGSITGVVTASDTQAPIEGVEVQLYTYINEGQTELVASGTTGADGVFVIGDVQPTTYVITFTPSNPDYVATTEPFFEVVEGENRLDQVLERSATVSGTVLAESAEGPPAVIPGVRVNLISVGDRTPLLGADVDENGNYAITGVPSGTYDVEFNAVQGIPTHLTSFIGESLDSGDAEKLTVEIGKDVVGVDATLILGSTISGSITGSDGVTQTGASAAIFRQEADGAWASEKALQGSTDANGDYTIVGLRPGAYRVGFLNRYEGSGQYRPEYFDDEPTVKASATIELDLHENVSGISAVLEPADGQSASPTPPTSSAAPLAAQRSGEDFAATGTTTRLAPFAAALVAIGLSLAITSWNASRSRGQLGGTFSSASAD